MHLDVLNNSCVDCHKTLSPFTDEQNRLNEIRLNHTVRNISCSFECHADIIRKKATDNFQQWSDSIHSKYYVTCDSCHGGDPGIKTEAGAHAPMKNIDNPNSPIYFKNIPDTCGKCHAEELDNFKNTMHYQRLRAESRAPSCVTCHQPHTYKVLKASELTALCSVCHNPKDQIAPVSVPNDAKQALEKQKEFREELLKAKDAVSRAKAKGMDVSTARNDIDKAQAVMDDIPSLWHGFNLKDFDRQIQNGINWAKKAEFKVSDVEPTVPRTPAIGITTILGIFAILYLIRKR
ncbi:MAG: ammonia-forming cytochrome c nitrite reductase subunit c552 [Candidatus Methanoperedens sp.]|nr:ammonia-forming cytochrome c nitrite reductase subunit c552 [Candidatus Methanoperedens sp.]